MRVWLWSLVLAPAIALFFFAAPAGAAGVQFRPGHHVQGGGRSGSSLFPLVTWLRDAAVEFVFGKHSSSSSSSSSKQTDSSALWLPAAQVTYYSKQAVLRFKVATVEEEAALAEAVDRLFLDVWSFDNHTGSVDIRLEKDEILPLLTLLPASMQYAFSPLIPDLGAAVLATYPDRVRQQRHTAKPGGGDWPVDGGSSAASGKAAPLANSGLDNVFFQDYQPLPVIVQWMKLLDAMFPFVNAISVGQSAEGRDILALRVGASPGGGRSSGFESNESKSDKGGDGDEGRPEDSDRTKKYNSRGGPGRPAEAPPPAKRKTIVITGGLHAREWVSISTVNYVAWSLIAGYGHTDLITKLVDSFDIVFVPVVNPDGYEYTWHTDRLWRKTRQGTNFRYCLGVDLDHAFGYAWDKGVRLEPCSETYGGEAAFQAVEARSLATWARNETELNGVDFVAFLDLHSYSQQIMFPFSYTCRTDPPNIENLEELAAGIAKAIRLSTGEHYTISSACEGAVSSFHSNGAASGSDSNVRIESGGGSAIDWFYHELGAKYSYQIKLRDTGSYGFLLPSSEIVPTGEEVFSAVKYVGDFLLGNNGIEKSYGAGQRNTEQAVEGDQDVTTANDAWSTKSSNPIGFTLQMDTTEDSDQVRLAVKDNQGRPDGQYAAEMRRRRRR